MNRVFAYCAFGPYRILAGKWLRSRTLQSERAGAGSSLKARRMTLSEVALELVTLTSPSACSCPTTRQGRPRQVGGPIRSGPVSSYQDGKNDPGPAQRILFVYAKNAMTPLRLNGTLIGLALSVTVSEFLVLSEVIFDHDLINGHHGGDLGLSTQRSEPIDPTYQQQAFRSRNGSGYEQAFSNACQIDHRLSLAPVRQNHCRLE